MAKEKKVYYLQDNSKKKAGSVSKIKKHNTTGVGDRKLYLQQCALFEIWRASFKVESIVCKMI